VGVSDRIMSVAPHMGSALGGRTCQGGGIGVKNPKKGSHADPGKDRRRDSAGRKSRGERRNPPKSNKTIGDLQQRMINEIGFGGGFPRASGNNNEKRSTRKHKPTRKRGQRNHGPGVKR